MRTVETTWSGSQGIRLPALVQVMLGLLLVTAGVTIVGAPAWVAVPLGLVLSCIVAYRFPLVTVTTCLILGVLQLSMTERFPTLLPISVGWGVNAIDIILVGMSFAVVFRAVADEETRQVLARLSLFSLPFVLWLVFEVARNFESLGLAAPSEFRFRYLMLFGVFYTAAMFTSSGSRRQLVYLLTLGFIPAVIGVVLLEAFVAGVSFGPSSRFLHSSGSLALLEAFTVFVIAQKYRLIKRSRFLTIAFGIITAVLLVADGHRSVWLAAAAIGAVLLLLAEVRLPAALAVSSGVAAVFASIGIFAFGGLDRLLDYFGQRSLAFTDYAADPTSAWRVMAWTAALAVVARNPLFGIGFGGYWQEVINASSGIGLIQFPHNYYVMTLVKLGAVGLALHLLFVSGIAWMLISSLKSLRDESERGLVICGLVALTAIHAYGVGYGLEQYSWLVLGLSLAAVQQSRRQRGAELEA